jgi:hypothetical protein
MKTYPEQNLNRYQTFPGVREADHDILLDTETEQMLELQKIKEQ